MASKAQRVAGKAVDRLLSAPPGWLAALREDSSVSQLGVRWLDDSTMRRFVVGVEKRFLGEGRLTRTAQTDRYCRQHGPHMVAVANGPGFVRGTPGFGGFEAVWYVDSRAPDQMLLACESDYPPFLWIPAGTSVDAMTRALTDLFLSPPPKRADLSRVVRAFVAYRNWLPQLEDVFLDEYLGHRFGLMFAEADKPWGSACLDSPFPQRPEDYGPLLDQAVRYAQARQQGDGVPSMAWKTAHSGSHLRVEAHRGQIFVIEARYRPSLHTELVESLNKTFDWSFPTDMPVDLIGALMSWDDFATVEEVQRRIAATGDDLGLVLGMVEILAALWYDDLDATSGLRGWLRHPNKSFRVQVANLALEYNLLFLLEELALDEPDATLVEQGHHVLNQPHFFQAHPNLFNTDDRDDTR